MAVTHADTAQWTDELERMIASSSPEEAAALTALKSELDPYFDRPEIFNTLLSKIQRRVMSADVEEELSSRTFTDLSEVEALLPEGVTVSTI